MLESFSDIWRSKTGGTGEQEDGAIYNGLGNIMIFMIELRNGRSSDPQFQPQPDLIRTCEKQIEEEGANEEIDSLSQRKQCIMKDQTVKTKRIVMNIFIDMSNIQPRRYQRH
ncbi:MAG: hypothetical protein EZS28_020133 [Streblomastix strix]|uniref:Uncharacterized protein n=1 Tax=Streblomastix strix TaxID=222440 RepID=A0A5J4VPX7_9EUKA|nr:MAG: hypothetical protein EZS28_020133 [Streblomastix strix]